MPGSAGNACRSFSAFFVAHLFLALQCATAAWSLSVQPRSETTGLTIPLTVRTIDAAQDGDLWARHAFYAAQRRRSGVNVPAKHGGQFFTGTVQVGSQTVELLFDTASQKVLLDIGVYSPGASSKELFDARYSFGAVGDFSVKVYTDTVSVGGLELQNVNVGAAQPGGPERVVPGEVGQGVLGLDFPGKFDAEPAGAHTNGVVEELFSQKGINGFTLDVSGGGGTLRLGDVGAGVPGMAYLPTTKFGGGEEWFVRGAAINGIPLEVCIDSGGGDDSYIATETVQQLAKQLGLPLVDYGGTPAIVTDCGTQVDITLEFGPTRVKLANELLWREMPEAKYKGKCNLRFYGGGDGQFAAIGAMLFKSAIVAFDYTGHRVGFAAK